MFNKEETLNAISENARVLGAEVDELLSMFNSDQI